MSKRSTSKASRSSSSRSAGSAPFPTSVSSLPSTASDASGSATNLMPSIAGLLERIDTAVKQQPKSTWRPASAPETRQQPDSSKSARTLLQENATNVMLARSRIEAGRRGPLYFLSVPGLIRILEVLLAVIHIAIFGFYCTHYERVINIIIPPFFLVHSREQFFMMANYHSLMGNMAIILTGLFSSKSNTSLISSLYPLIYDFLQSLTLSASSASVLIFYFRYPIEIERMMPDGANYKKALMFTGMFLAILHFISIIYDWNVYMKRVKIKENERENREEYDA
ncbi:hypothetical protein JTE90_000532 [Oedothorax gibbosus]|uniref:Uncharacterized protein n=1 Tax=Oedothorax gibbosus TaxID=931172 RepID=A0AAV6VWJ1_9ARAC|nr:hypothetical protein JTE90_000532 [Oedothorax gibbosus]